MKNIFPALFLFLFTASYSSAQELYPNAEPASNIPKGVLGIRFANEFFDEAGEVRSWQGYKFMFGLTKNFQLTQTFSFSNHHGIRLPSDFIRTDGNIGPHTHGVTKGKSYPYLFETMNINVKYRFLSCDGERKHFRMAAWFEAAGGNEAHDEAEPSMMGDNAGLSMGLIATQLINKIAVSGTLSGMLAVPYYERTTAIEIRYGKLLHYDLSLGYLFLPFKYKDYKQTNVNLYLEFMGRSYDSAVITQNGDPINTDGVLAFESGNYMEVRPAVQFIFNSNMRVDLASSFLLFGRSYTKFYPAFYFNLQRYFYFSDKK